MFDRITKSLHDGSRLHTFLSAGGLRVVRIESGTKLKGYGEHFEIFEALALADASLKLLRRTSKKSTYLTGSSTAANPFDEWIMQGKNIDAWSNGAIVKVQMLDRSYQENPSVELLRQVFEAGSAEWHHRGGITLLHEVSYHPKRVEHQYDYSLETIKPCTKAVRYTVAKTGEGEDFFNALLWALAAPQLEIKENKLQAA